MAKITIVPREPINHTYFTYQNPDKYHPDWKGFYDWALIESSKVRKELDVDCRVQYGDTSFNFANIFYDRRNYNEEGKPIILYFHGGRWREGHQDHYDALALNWVKKGAVFGSFGYRLEPDYTIKDAIWDVAKAVQWAIENANKYNVNPKRIILAGHSAGAHIVQMISYTDFADGEWKENIIGVIGMSSPSLLGDLIPNDSVVDELTPVYRVTRSPNKSIISYGTPELNKKQDSETLFEDSGRAMSRALLDKGFSVTVVEMPETNHLETALEFGRETSTLFQESLKLVFGQER